MAEYSNLGIYVLLKSGDKFPDGVKAPTPGEGANTGKLADGRTWFKNCFAGPVELRDMVHAEDAGLLDMKTAEQMRAIMPNAKDVEI